MTSSPETPRDPTHHHEDYKLRFGHPLPFGASHVPGGVNFSIFSKHAKGCVLVLFDRGAPQPFAEIPFPPEFRMGDIYSMIVYDVDYQHLEYGFRFDGEYEPRRGDRFDPDNILLDPYAREIGGRDVWLQLPPPDEIMPHRSRVPYNDFDWGHDRPLELPQHELIIYEMHLRGFTRHDSSGVRHPGTYEGLKEKIPYLKELGVNCVELMPIFEFDEFENERTNPQSGELLCNYWGYSTVGFYAPKSGYAATGCHGTQVRELKSLIHALHAAGIQVFLDVVFNHTAEGGEGGPTISFRGIDNRTYYLLERDGSYANFTGCGNTMNCNHPVVRGFVVDCLRYWAAEYHIDGFRFDLASVLGRDCDGNPLQNPPLLESLAHDPVLAHCELIAEAWDAGGLYQVGSFPDYGRWSEWNGKYRDAARRFLKGEPGVAGEMVQRILGSPDLYGPTGRKPQASVNFICCHDGFTLRDLFSYNEKHNEENAEDNCDGSNDNNSWNCGIEGVTDDSEINALRLRMQKNAVTLLFVSQGIPMLYMGDECGRTQRGNNNAYCHDADWNWLDWDFADHGKELLRFTKAMIAFRKRHPLLQRSDFFMGRDIAGSGYPDISWHGIRPWKPDWGESSHSLAFMICGKHSEQAGGPLEFVYCVFNMYYNPLEFGLPLLPQRFTWKRFADTAAAAPADIHDPDQSDTLQSQRTLEVPARSCSVLLATCGD